jgi:hypothetical protein
LPWADSNLTAEDIVESGRQLKRMRIKVNKVKISGGECLLHPEFPALVDLLIQEWRLSCKVTVYSNALVKRNSGRAKVVYVPVETKQQTHLPFAVSPADLGHDPYYGPYKVCRMAAACGRGFEAFGWTFCQIAGPIGRAIGIDPYSPYPVSMADWRICRHCVFTLGRLANKVRHQAMEGKIPFPTKTYQEAFEKGTDSLPVFDKFLDRLKKAHD